MSERGGGKRTIEWTWVVRGHGLPERMSVCVGVCLPVFVYESGGRAGVHFGGASHDCHRESTANRLLMWRTWFKKKKKQMKERKSTALKLCIFRSTRLPQHHRDPARGSAIDTCMSLKVCVHRLLQALQHEHCNGNTRPPGGAVSPGDRVVLRIIDLVSVEHAESTIAPQ